MLEATAWRGNRWCFRMGFRIDVDKFKDISKQQASVIGTIIAVGLASMILFGIPFLLIMIDYWVQTACSIAQWGCGHWPLINWGLPK